MAIFNGYVKIAIEAMAIEIVSFPSYKMVMFNSYVNVYRRVLSVDYSSTHDGSMVLLYMVTWIPSIYPSHVSIYIYHTWILWVIDG